MPRLSLVVCSLCGEPAEHVRVPVTVGSVGPLELDLCDEDYKIILGPVLDALSVHGMKPQSEEPERRRRQRQGKARTVGPFRCKLCVSAPLKNKVTFDAHLRGLHDMNVVEYVEQHGALVPLTPEEAAEPVSVTCPLGCGQAYSTPDTRWPQQAMVSHMWGHHGVKWRPGQYPVG